MQKVFLSGAVAAAASIGILRNQKRTHAKSSESSSCPKSVVVIGAGLMGLGTALHLVERGHKVTVLDKASDVATRASGGNGSYICPTVSIGWANIKISMFKGKSELKEIKFSRGVFLDPWFWKWSFWFLFNGLWPGRSERNNLAMFQLAKYSHQCLRQLEDKFGELIDMDKTECNNTLKLYYDQAKVDKFMASGQAKFWKENGHSPKVLSPIDCRLVSPHLQKNDPETATLVAGVWSDPPADSTGDSKKFCKNLEKLCLQKGVDIVTGAEVTAFRTGRNGEITSVKVAKKAAEETMDVVGDVFVLAAGVESGKIARMAGVNLPIYPLKGSIVDIPLKDGVEMTFQPSVIDTDTGLCVCPMKYGSLRASSGAEAVGFDYSLDKVLGQKTIAKTLRIFKKEDLDLDNANYISCLRPMSGDDIPIIGRTLVPNLYTNTGHGSKGWTLSFGSVQLLADIIEGKSPEVDPTPYSPIRFHPIRRLLTLFTS